MRRPPGVAVVAPRVGPRLDRGEPVDPVVVGQAAPGPGEPRVQRRGVLVALVEVAAGRVGLPDLDQLAPHRPAVAVEHPPGHDHPLPHRLAVVLHGQVGLARADLVLPEHRRPQLQPLGVDLLERLGGVPQQAGAVRRVVQPRLGLAPRQRRRDRLDLRRHLGLAALCHAPDGRARAGDHDLPAVPPSGSPRWLRRLRSNRSRNPEAVRADRERPPLIETVVETLRPQASTTAHRACRDPEARPAADGLDELDRR